MEGLADTVLGNREAGSKPPRWWMIVTALAGAAGALLMVTLFAKGTYTVTPFRVELSAKASAAGNTEMTIRPADGLEPGFAQANTHQSPITFRMTVVGVGAGSTITNPELLTDPYTTARHIRYSEEGRQAIAGFGKTLGLLALAGGALGGLLVSFGRWKRVLGGALAGAATIGAIGFALHQSYDLSKFQGTEYRPPAQSAPLLPGE